MTDGNTTQLHGLKPEDLLRPLKSLQKQVEELKISLNTKAPIELLSRQEVASLLKTNYQTVSNWTKNGKLTIYGIGGRRYYKRNEVENSLIQLNHKKESLND